MADRSISAQAGATAPLTTLGDDDLLIVSHKDGATYEDATIEYADLEAQVVAAVSGAKPTEVVAFTSSGTFSKADYSGLYAIRVRIVGGGGGSGGAEGGGSGCAGGMACGGGEYAEKLILASALAADETVTIGAGGTAGSAGANNGGNGGTTSFGTLVTAVGGSAGDGGATSTTVPRSGTSSGGAGGTGGTGGDLHIAGDPGLASICLSVTAVTASVGGSSHLSGQSKSANNATTDEAGTAGVLYGGGASGGRSSSDATDRAGAAGGKGVCIIDIYR
jgi:hypothetical protein